MEILSKILIAIVALEHLYILYMEMFAWETLGKRSFKGALPDELFKPTKGLARNQGLYNGFLSAGLVWSLLISDEVWAKNVAVFFLGCVIVAGIFGAVTASRKIFFVQALPAIVALVCVLLFDFDYLIIFIFILVPALFFIPIPFIYRAVEKNGKKNFWKFTALIFVIYLMTIAAILYGLYQSV